MENAILGPNPFLYPMSLPHGRDSGRAFSPMGRRHYDPTVGRFLEPDSAQWLDPKRFGGINPYAYCLNDPIAYADHTGHMPDWAKWLIGGAVILGLGFATFFTGGAAGVIFGAAFYGAVTGAVGGAAVSGLIQGVLSAAKGGNFWEGLSHGAADGFMWGAAIGGAVSAMAAGINIGTGMVAVSGNAQKTGYFFHSFASKVNAGKFAMQIGRYSSVTMNRSLSSSDLVGLARPDVLAVGPSGAKAVEIASLTQTVATEKAKIAFMKSMNPMLVGKAIDWIFGWWFFL